MSRKLDEIASLHDGWWGPGSIGIDGRAVEVVREALVRYPALADSVTVGPLPSGSVMLEWSRNGHVYTAEIEKSGEMELTDDNVATDHFESRTVQADAITLLEFLIGTTR